MARFVLLLVAVLLCATLVAGLTAGEMAVLTACGVTAATSLQTNAPACAKEAMTAKACPASCKSVIASTKVKARAAALSKLSTPAVDAKIAKVRGRESAPTRASDSGRTPAAARPPARPLTLPPRAPPRSSARPRSPRAGAWPERRPSAAARRRAHPLLHHVLARRRPPGAT